jgi:cytochrome c-type biogenesis protein CcmH
MSLRRWLPWLALALVLVVALAIGSTGRHQANDLTSRTLRIASGIRCPTCSGQSAADSDAQASQEIRAIISQRLQQGQSASQIEAYLVSRYGARILLRPQTHGLSLVVWVLPLVAGAAGVAGLALAFARWRARPAVVVSDEDRRLVDEALKK